MLWQQSRQRVRQQASRQALTLGLLGVGGMLFLAAVALSGLSWGIPFDHFSRDAAAVVDAEWYVGLVSNLGIVAWFAGAAIGIFSCSVVLMNHRAGLSIPGRVWFTGAFALLTGLLALDDLVMIHEVLVPRTLGLSEHWVMAGYAFALAVILWSGREELLRSDWLILLVAGGLFAGSVGMEAMPTLGRTADYLLEDGLKFLAILFWTTYVCRTAASLLIPSTNKPSAPSRLM